MSGPNGGATPRGGAPGGACAPGRPLDAAGQAAALSSAHAFPGVFPVVVIARHEPGFEQRLLALVVELQAGAPHSLSRRASRGGTYVSYRLQLHVSSAEEAVARRARFAALEQVVLCL